jgi:hypothetical protein
VVVKDPHFCLSKDQLALVWKQTNNMWKWDDERNTFVCDVKVNTEADIGSHVRTFLTNLIEALKGSNFDGKKFVMLRLTAEAKVFSIRPDFWWCWTVRVVWWDVSR